jgi:hypothetical protein
MPISRILPLLLLISCVPAAQAQKPRPEWLGKEPLIIVGNWDSMPIFRRRVGGAAPDMEEVYAREHTEEAVRKLKDLGVTMAVIHFYKGFGLEAEKQHMEDSRKLAALLKKNGLRVGVYVGSTIGFETFLSEKPEAAEWFAPDYLGKPVIYGNQTFRKRVYFMHPGYREYMRRVLRIALEDLHADLIHFDNTSMQAQPQIFLHPLAVRDFRAWLERKYTAEERTLRFGFPRVEHMEPPALDRPVAVLDDPLFAEWTDFRCEQLSNYYAEMESYIRSLNPHAAVESNPHSGISGHNTAWEQGVDYPRLLSHMDVVWTEEGNEAHVTPEGVLVSKIRSYKMAQSLNNRIFTYTGGGRGGKLQMAEAMAFNRQTLGQIGSVLAGYDFPADQAAYVSFFRRNFDLFRDVRTRADVAVLHSYASMAYNSDLPWQSGMLVEQALIQGKVAFDIIFDDQLRDLSRYRALILADQECLTEAQMALIRQYVEDGGGLLATERTSLYDQWRRRRSNFGLSETFGVNAPKYAEELYTFRPMPATRGQAGASPTSIVRPPANPSPAGAAASPVRRSVGHGRSVYLPFVMPAIEKPSGMAMTSQYWKRPVNWQEILNEVKWAANGFSLEVKGPATLVAEPLVQEPGGRMLVHLLNYDVERRPSVENLEVSIRVPQGKAVRAASLLSPDATSSLALAPAVKGDWATFAVPRMRTYSIVAIDLR